MMPIETEAAKHSSSDLDSASKYATGVSYIDAEPLDAAVQSSQTPLEILQNYVRANYPLEAMRMAHDSELASDIPHFNDVTERSEDTPEDIMSSIDESHGKHAETEDTAMTVGDLAKHQSKFITQQQDFFNGAITLTEYQMAQENFFISQSRLIQGIDPIRYSQMLGQCIAKQTALLHDLGIV